MGAGQQRTFATAIVGSMCSAHITRAGSNHDLPQVALTQCGGMLNANLRADHGQKACVDVLRVVFQVPCRLSTNRRRFRRLVDREVAVNNIANIGAHQSRATRQVTFKEANGRAVDVDNSVCKFIHARAPAYAYTCRVRVTGAHACDRLNPVMQHAYEECTEGIIMGVRKIASARGTRTILVLGIATKCIHLFRTAAAVSDAVRLCRRE